MSSAIFLKGGRITSHGTNRGFWDDGWGFQRPRSGMSAAGFEPVGVSFPDSGEQRPAECAMVTAVDQHIGTPESRISPKMILTG